MNRSPAREKGFWRLAHSKRLFYKESRMATAMKEIPLVNGPSKWDLVVALFERADAHPHEVQFETGGGQAISATVHRAGHVPGSMGLEWTLDVLVKTPYFCDNPADRSVVWNGLCKVEFRTDKRKGILYAPEGYHFDG